MTNTAAHRVTGWSLLPSNQSRSGNVRGDSGLPGAHSLRCFPLWLCVAKAINKVCERGSRLKDSALPSCFHRKTHFSPAGFLQLSPSLLCAQKHGATARQGPFLFAAIPALQPLTDKMHLTQKQGAAPKIKTLPSLPPPKQAPCLNDSLGKFLIMSPGHFGGDPPQSVI